MNLENLENQKLIFRVINPNEPGIHPFDNILCVFLDENDNRLGNSLMFRDFLNRSRTIVKDYPNSIWKEGKLVSRGRDYYIVVENFSIEEFGDHYCIFEYDKTTQLIEIIQDKRDYLELIYYSKYIDNTFWRSR